MSQQTSSSASQGAEIHVPVLKDEVLSFLAPQDNEIFVDGTFGAGGYTRAILGAADCRVYAIDRDPTAVARGRQMEKEYGGRLKMLEGCFGDMDQLLADEDVGAVDGVALDIGVSSMQLDEAGRGFSFNADGPLDMRMSSGGRLAGESAADVVNAASEAELTKIFRDLGEERHAGLMARAIVKDRAEVPFTTTRQLASLAERVLGKFYKSGKQGGKKAIHPATRIFQALRIHVNDELGELSRGLQAAKQVLAPGGRLAVVSFHSLEDRMVKTFLLQESGGAPKGSRHQPDDPSVTGASTHSAFRLSKRGAIKPSQAEMNVNPRARSARLRVAERLDDAKARPKGGSA